MNSSVAFFILASIFLFVGSTSAAGSCPRNEERASCGPRCEPTCRNPNPTLCSEGCQINGCRCSPGYYRQRLGDCIPLASCPPFGK